MRNYGRSFLRNEMRRESAARSETRDGVLWDVDHLNGFCRVKIQGSDELVVAHYPENWEHNPSWLKQGNAVRIVHRGGVRGKIEVIGHGQTIPTAMGNSVTPQPVAPPDALLFGCQVMQIPKAPVMAVMVTTGAIRIGGSVLKVPPIKMTTPDSVFKMSMGGNMGNVAAVFPIAGVWAGQFRRDIVVVGNNGVVNLISGGVFSTTEVVPPVPAGYLYLNSVLVCGGGRQTAITAADIGSPWHPPEITQLKVTFDVNPGSGKYFGNWQLAGGGQPQPGYKITVTAVDQYNCPLVSKAPLGWQMTIKRVNGTVTIYGGMNADGPSSLDQLTLLTGGNAGNTWFLAAAAADQYAQLTCTIAASYNSVETHIIIPA